MPRKTDRARNPTCLHCRITIYPGRGISERKFCSRECGGKHQALKNLGTRPAPRVLFRCEQCHHGQLILASDAEGKRYCSRKCRGAARSAKNKALHSPVTCGFCRETKLYPAKEAKARKFCGIACKKAAYREHLATTAAATPRKVAVWDFRGEDEPNIPPSDGRRLSW